MKKKILNIMLFVVLIAIIIFGITRLANEELIEYGIIQKNALTQKIESKSKTTSPPNQWESTNINQEYGIPMYNNETLYCVGAGTRVRDVGTISFASAKAYHNRAFDVNASIGVNNGELTYVVYKYVDGGNLPSDQAYVVSSEGNSKWTEKKQHALWNLSGSSGLVHDNNGMKAQGAKLAEEAKLYAAGAGNSSQWDKVSADSSKVTVKVDQKAKEYIVGPFTVNYPESAKQNGGATGGISNMELNGGKVDITALIINGERKKPDYFKADTKNGGLVDKEERFYPESGEKFYIVFSDTNGVTEVTLNVEFKYLVAEGEYKKYTGTQYKVCVDYYDTDGDGYADEKVVRLAKASSAPQDAMWAEAEAKVYDKEIVLEPINIGMEIGGYVWEDGAAGKETQIDGSKSTSGNVDKPLQNIRVILSDGQETRTGEDGGYKFENLNALKKYTVSFEYNGQIYIPTEYMAKGVSWEDSSKGLEKQEERNAFDKKFAEIGSSPNNYGNNKRTFTKLELMGYELGVDGKYHKTGVQLIDGYEYDENGFETDKYTLATQNPNTSDSEIVAKLQFIEDCKIKSYSAEYPDLGAFVIGSSSETLLGKTYKELRDRVLYINQGLCKRQEYDAAIRKDVYGAALKINDKTVVYKYDKRSDDEKYWDINVRMSDYESYYASGYNRELYKSDYEYEPQEGYTGSPLDVYVTYKITVRNQSMSTMTQIKEIVDFYDKEYTYIDNLSWVTYTEGNKTNSVTDEEYYNAINSENTSSIVNARPVNSSSISRYGEKTHSDLATSGKYGSIYIKGLEDKKLATGESAYIYLTFKVNKENGKVILDNENNSKQNFAEINGYATFYKDGTNLPNGINKSSNDVAGLIDIDSNPGNLCLKDIEANDKYERNFEDDTDRAKGLRILIDENAVREINGTVWEDERNQSSSEAMIGDGIKADKETKVAGVTVQLVEKLSSGQEYIWRQTTTDTNGYYKFTGYIPGDYVVRFGYGNNTSTVETKENGGLNIISYNGQDFKSTIYQVGMNQNEIYNIYEADAYEKNVSDAKDIWSRREAVINYSNTDVTNHKAEVLASPYETPTYNGVEYTSEERKALINELITNTYMVAETGVIAVEFEYDRNRTDGDKVSNGNNYLYGNDINGKYTLNNVDFGLVERPKAQLEIDKSISNVKVVLANNSVLFDVNKGNKVNDFVWSEHVAYNLETKKDENAMYEEYYGSNSKNRYSYRNEVDKLVNKNNGLIQVIMDEELMHGATIQITYKVKVTNVGEVDYSDKEFYYTGKQANKNANIVTTKATQVVDYIANNLQFDVNNAENTNNWKMISKNELVSNGIVNNKLAGQVNSFNNILETTSFDKYNLKPGESTEEKPLVLTQLITTKNSSDNLSYDNMVEIVKTSNSVGRRMAYSVVGNQNPTTKPIEIDSSKAESVLVLPPFGQMHIYYILAVAVAIVLIAGIVFIIKKVLKK